MLDVLLETIVDSIKLLPFLFLAYLLIEFIENKAQEKTTKAIEKNRCYLTPIFLCVYINM